MATTSDGTRSLRASAGADLTIREEMIVLTGLRETDGQDRTTANLWFDLPNCITA